MTAPGRNSPPAHWYTLQTALSEALADPAVAQCLSGARLPRMECEAADGDLYAVFIRKADELVALSAKLPLARLLGPWQGQFWKHILMNVIRLSAGDDDDAGWIFPWRLARLSPDNPLEISSLTEDGEPLILWREGAAVKDAIAVVTYQAWLRQQRGGVRPRGRPKKAPGAPVMRAASRIPPEEQARARELRQQGKRIYEIAAEMGYDGDPKGDGARKWVRRRLEALPVRKVSAENPDA